MNNPASRPTAFVLSGPSRWIDEIEELIHGWMDETILLGSSRETWRDVGYTPDQQVVQLGENVGGEAEGDNRENLILYFQENLDATELMGDLLERVHDYFKNAGEFSPDRLLICRPLALPAVDWATQWRDYFQPIRVSNDMIIVPEWIDPENAKADLGLGPGAACRVLRMIPGQAFGSGTHPTTQLALRRLEHSLRPGARVLDFGAGSGILSFAAALLGAREIVAIEVDAECEENFRENLALNPPPDARVAVKFRVGSSERIAPGESFDLIVCNALFNRVKNHFAALARALAPGGIFIYSGFMDTEDDEVLGLLRSLKLRMMSEDQLQEWGLVESRRETGDGVS